MSNDIDRPSITALRMTYALAIEDPALASARSALIDEVFIPHEHALMDGEYGFAQKMVAPFTAYHRAAYFCKTGLGDMMVGAAAAIAEYNGAQAASHVKDKLVEMTHLDETI